MKNRFTIQIRGNVDYATEPELQAKITEVLALFPDFRLTGKNVEIWQNARGEARLFNDDGTDYVEPVEEAGEEPVQEESVEEPTAQEEATEEVADEKKDETVVEGEG